jgi:hypothetical protein
MPLLGAVAVSHLGLVMIRAGNVAEGIAKLKATRGVIKTMGFNGQAAYCLAALAEGYLTSGDPEAARTAARQAITAAAARSDFGAHAQAVVVLADCARHMPVQDGTDPATLLAEALAIAERLSLSPLAARCRTRMAVAM